jgi:hypothetical protein
MTNAQSKAGDDGERLPPMQLILDNPFILLFAGVAIPAVLYIIWGVMEVAQIPIGQ